MSRFPLERGANRSGAPPTGEAGAGQDHLVRPREPVLAAFDAAWCVYSSPSLHHRGSAYVAARGIDDSGDGLVTALRAQGFGVTNWSTPGSPDAGPVPVVCSTSTASGCSFQLF